MTSEFGAGVVVCLAKFSEHLGEHGPYSETLIRRYEKWTPESKRRAEREASGYPVGDSAKLLIDMRTLEVGAEVRGNSKERSISSAITMWAHAAGDHFFDLDRDKAPPSLIELADLVLNMRNLVGEKQWTVKDLDRVRNLWKQSCIQIDRDLIGTSPDWGDW